MCDSNHFTFPEPSRWSVLYGEINTLVKIKPALGGRGQKVTEKTTFGRALFRIAHCVDGLKVQN